MLFEEILILIAGGIAIFMIGIPGFRMYRTFFPAKKNPLKDAKQRLEQARLDIEAARLNKEAEGLYSRMFDESLEEDASPSDKTNSRRV